MAGWLGIDMGGTASRFVWQGPDGGLVRGAAPGATGLLYDETRRARFTEALAAIRAALPEAPEAVHLGITGAGAGADPQIAALVLGVFGPLAVSHENDAELAHRAAFSGGAGILVIAGTGSVGIGRADAGFTLVGGRGALVDDRGSASWIALEALKAVYAQVDARGGPGPLAALAREIDAEAGGDWEAQKAILYGPDRGRIGLLAPAVARAAEAGCAVSSRILEAAGRELALMRRLLGARLGALPSAYSGGVLALSPSIRSAILQADPGASFPPLDPALAAALHARKKGLAL